MRPYNIFFHKTVNVSDRLLMLWVSSFGNIDCFSEIPNLLTIWRRQHWQINLNILGVHMSICYMCSQIFVIVVPLYSLQIVSIQTLPRFCRVSNVYRISNISQSFIMSFLKCRGYRSRFTNILNLTSLNLEWIYQETELNIFLYIQFTNCYKRF